MSLRRPSMLAPVIASSTLALFVAGCGGGTESSGAAPDGASSSATGGGHDVTAATTASTGSGETTGAGGAPPVGDTHVLAIEPFDAQPGTERQVCKTINLPFDHEVDVVVLRSEMKGTSHHFNAYKVLTDPTAPVTEEESTVHDCAPAAEQLGGDAAYFFGSAQPERVLNLPAGVAYHFLPGQRIILEQHVINSSSDVIQGGVDFELGLAAPESVIEHHADVMWFASWSFFLPPSQTTSDTAFCAVPYDVEVFGLASHTHALGSHFSIEKRTDAGTEHLYDSEDWQHPPFSVYSPTISLAAGEGLEWTCTWDNTTTKLVGPGKDSTDEMCITFAYAYPKGSLGADPIQCNQ
jgi:hypothetical protein